MRQKRTGLKDIYEKSGMKVRLYVVLLLFLFVPITGIVFYVWNYSVNSFHKTAESAARESFSTKSMQIDDYLQNITSISDSILQDPRLSDYILQDYNTSFTAWRIGNLIQGYVSVPQQELLGIYIKTCKGNEYLTDCHPDRYMMSLRREHAQQYAQLSRICDESENQIDTQVSYLGERECIAVSFPVMSVEDEVLGHFLMLLGYDKVMELVDSVSEDIVWSFRLRTDTQELCTGRRYYAMISGAETYEADLGRLGWKLDCVVNLNEQLQEVFVKFIGVIVLIIVIYGIILLLMTVLLNHQERVIQNLMQEQKDTELKALELEINPHFLANTLNMINSVAIEHKEYQISKMLKSFSLIFNYIIRERYKPVSIRQEVEWLEDYLLLQKERFDSSFDYEIDLDPAVSEELIYKMLLQPFIENAIVHGFEKMDKKGMLTCIFTKEEEHIKIIIADNGQGIDGETMRLIETCLENPEAELKEQFHIGIGIINSFKRIRGYYGDNFRLHIRSDEKDGTTVEVELPCLKEQEA